MNLTARAIWRHARFPKPHGDPGDDLRDGDLGARVVGECFNGLGVEAEKDGLRWSREVESELKLCHVRRPVGGESRSLSQKRRALFLARTAAGRLTPVQAQRPERGRDGRLNARRSTCGPWSCCRHGRAGVSRTALLENVCGYRSISRQPPYSKLDSVQVCEAETANCGDSQCRLASPSPSKGLWMMHCN